MINNHKFWQAKWAFLKARDKTEQPPLPLPETPISGSRLAKIHLGPNLSRSLINSLRPNPS